MTSLRDNSEVLARLRPFGISMEKSLSDLIKGIRSHLSQESPEGLVTFLESCILECKRELSTTDLETKSMAILKLTYLEMYGFDMSWSNFHILEVMASSKFQQKRIGYLAAIQSFKNEQELLILATNQFKKDLGSHQHIEIGLALSGIATIVTPVLAKDINDDVVKQLNHSKPYVRKKAILAMYKIFLQYPDSLRLNLDRIIERLEDPDVSVVGATINVVCEVSKKNPQIFLGSIPKFFDILQSSENNWLTIKVLKLFQSLSKVEPRLKKKILPFLLQFLDSTKAISLVHEIIDCIVNGDMLSANATKTAGICVNKLMGFFDMNDPNLRFVGLLVLIKILKKFPSFISSVKKVPNVILNCLSGNDMIIKRKALEICHYLVDEDRLGDIVKTLLTQLIPYQNQTVPEYFKKEVSFRIIEICSQNNYSYIPNFKWYIAVLNDLVQLTLLPQDGSSRQSSSTEVVSQATSNIIASEIGNEFKNLATRVPSIRPIILQKVVFTSIQDIKILNACPILLKDLFWILGEYNDDYKLQVEDDNEGEDEVDDSQAGQAAALSKKVEIFNKIVSTKGSNTPVSQKLIQLSNPDVLIVLIQAAVKLYSGIVTDYIDIYSQDGSSLPTKNIDQLAFLLYKLVNFLGSWEKHSNYEVQERALSWLEFLKLLLEALSKGDLSRVKKLESEEIASSKIRLSKKVDSDESSDEYESNDEESEEEESEEEDSEEESEEEDDDDEEDHEDENEVVSEAVETKHEDEEEDNSLKSLPALLTRVLPSFFKSYSLNPISKNAQRKIVVPDDLDLSTAINLPPDLVAELEDDAGYANSQYNMFVSDDELEQEEILIDLESDTTDTKQKKKDRLDRMKDDPYYIRSSQSKKKTKPKKHALLLDGSDSLSEQSSVNHLTFGTTAKKKKPLKKEKVLILAEEFIGNEDAELDSKVKKSSAVKKSKKNVLRIDSSNLDNFDLNSSNLSESEGVAKPFEYDIDLNELRNKLAATSLDKVKKKKKSDTPKKKTKKKLANEDVTTGKTSETTGEAPPEALASDAVTEALEPSDVAQTVKEIKKPKKKKKSKAVIE